LGRVISEEGGEIGCRVERRFSGNPKDELSGCIIEGGGW